MLAYPTVESSRYNCGLRITMVIPSNGYAAHVTRQVYNKNVSDYLKPG